MTSFNWTTRPFGVFVDIASRVKFGNDMAQCPSQRRSQPSPYGEVDGAIVFGRLPKSRSVCTLGVPEGVGNVGSAYVSGRDESGWIKACEDKAKS